MKRYNFVKDGKGSPYFALEKKQAKAAARKFFGCAHKLWQYLNQTNQIKCQVQYLVNGVWVNK